MSGQFKDYPLKKRLRQVSVSFEVELPAVWLNLTLRPFKWRRPTGSLSRDGTLCIGLLKIDWYLGW